MKKFISLCRSHFRARIFFLLTHSFLPIFCAAATSTGTGFFITSTGYIATNFHVVENATALSVQDIRGQTFPAKLVRSDAANDLAIIKVEGKFPALPIARSSAVRKGDSVFTLGFPNTRLQGLAVKLTEGTISSISGIQDEPNNFQISVPLQPGNSGGPLLNREGVVVGIVVAKLSAAAALKSGSSLPEAVNYAVKSNYLLELIDTDLNVSERVQIVLRKGKETSLPTLVAKTEVAVVFIVASKPGRERSATAPGNTPSPTPVLPPHPPRYERDASAIEDFQKGEKAEMEGRSSDAFRFYGGAANQGNAAAQAKLGFMYAQGLGVTKDDGEAVQWYRKSAEQGNVFGQYNLGFLFESGRGVTKDHVEAVQWYRKSAEQGFAGAQANLGRMYEYGRGITKDDVEAVQWYRRAVAQGNAYAQNSLGRMYQSGRGVAIFDDVEAVQWYRKSAAQGNSDAQYNLGFMYEQGRGVAKDDVEAVEWYRRAAAQGQITAQNSLRRKGLK